MDNKTKEKDCKWHFSPQEGGREDGPNDAMMQNFKSKPYQSLVREAVQNSLDAVLNLEKPVKVNIEVGSLDSASYPNFFNLKEHVLSCVAYFNWNKVAVAHYQNIANILEGNSIFGNNLFYIKVSDYNTKGMWYDSLQSNSPFYAFARAGGVSSKEGQGSGGSFGFGKSAYFQLSNISSVFISTMTEKGQRVFEGVSWLCTHNHEGHKVASVGYYDNNGGKPIESEEYIPDIFQRSEYGTDFYILGFDVKNQEQIEETKAEMIKEAIRSFWYAIYCGKLEIKVLGVNITKNTLDRQMNEYFPETVDNTRKGSNYNPHPYYIAVKDSDSNKKCFRFDSKMSILDDVTVFLYKCKDANDKVIYMRKPLMTVFGQKHRTNYGFYGVFVCTSQKGDDILRNMENPAHDEWKSSNWRMGANKYHYNPIGKQALDDIQSLINDCVEKVFANNPDTALEITGLNEFLYIPDSLIDDDENDFDHPFGSPTGNTKTEGAFITSEISNSNKKAKEEQTPNIGSVRIIKNGTPNDPNDYDDLETLINEPPDDLENNPIIKKKRKKKRHNDKIDEKPIENEDGTFKTYLPIQFRVIAQSEGDSITHNIIIYSPRDVIEGEIELITSGEQSDDLVDVIYTDNGKIKGNTITGIVLEEGKNTIKIRFKDNMRHALKLKAYENQ